ncbi:MAG: tRNA pseudouridine(38-40) synthase TruA [Gammaproteobacteria bacterium]
MRVALGVEYDGAAFSGFESQRNARTVQQCLEQALARVADEPVRVHCAGRTDAGVHATGQVVHFDTRAVRPDHAWVLGANANLPPDAAVAWSKVAAEDFHARFSALRRHYRYVIANKRIRRPLQHSRVALEYRPLDVERMNEAAASLLGEHDFSAYRVAGCQAGSPVRTLHELRVRREGELVCIDVCANAFLQHMVRNIAGVLMDIGAGKREAGWALAVLDGRQRSLGGVTAPARGLYFTCVEYPERFRLPQVSPQIVVW